MKAVVKEWKKTFEEEYEDVNKAVKVVERLNQAIDEKEGLMYTVSFVK